MNKQLKWLAFGFLVCCQQIAFGQTYEIKGSLNVKNYLNEELLSEFNFHYVVSVDGGVWRIDSADDMIQTKEGRTLLRQICAGTDGANIYSCATLYTNANPSSSNQMMQASVTEGLKPTFDASLQLIWLVFASSDYLSKHTNYRLTPPWVYDKKIDSPCTIKVRQSLSPPFLPDRILYFDGDHAPTGSTDYLLQANGRMLMGEYVVLTSTNIGGLTIPISFSLNRYQLPVNGIMPKEPKKVISVYHGEISQVEIVAPKDSYLPPLPKAAISTLDYRFADQNLKLDSLR